MVSNDRMIMHYRGLSGDDKPAEAPNGSDFLEIDTGKVWYFDATEGEWRDPTGSGSLK